MNIRRSLLLIFRNVALLVFVCAAVVVVAQTKTIALTIDDLPHNGPNQSVNDLRMMTRQFTDALRQNRVPAVGFVNEGQLYYVTGELDERVAILESWAKAGLELGNHTYSHVGLRDTPLDRYEDDFIRGDTVTRRIAASTQMPLRYFRHPFLQMGNTIEVEKAFDEFIGRRGYMAVPITLTTEDWMFLVPYLKAKKGGDKSALKKISDDYILFAKADAEYREKAAERLFGRTISHILLVHANEVTADNLDRLIAMYRSLGYRFVTVEEALKDPSYVFPEKYSPTSDWLRHWANSKAVEFDPPRPPEYIRKSLSTE